MSVDSINGVKENLIPFFLYNKNKNNSFLFVVNNNKMANSYKEIFDSLDPNLNCIVLPEFDTNFGEMLSCSSDLWAKRAMALFNIANVSSNFILIATVKSLSIKTVDPVLFREYLFIAREKIIKRSEFEGFLLNNGYVRASITDSKGQFSIRGEIIDIFPVTSEFPLRVNFDDNFIESIKVFDPISQISSRTVDNIIISRASEITLTANSIKNFRDNYFIRFSKNDTFLESARFFHGIEYFFPLFEKTVSIINYFPKKMCVYFDCGVKNAKNKLFSDISLVSNSALLTSDEIFEDVIEQIEHSYTSEQLTPFLESHLDSLNIRKYSDYQKLILNLPINKKNVFSVSSIGALHVLKEILGNFKFKMYKDIKYFCEASKNEVSLIISNLCSGGMTDDFNIYTEKEIFGRRLSVKRKKASIVFKNYNNLEVGDYVVHKKYGIALFKGIENVKINNIGHDFFVLEYRDDNRIFIPVEGIDQISRYSAPDAEAKVILDRLGGDSFERRSQKVRKKIFLIADHLIKLEAARKLQKSDFITADCEDFNDFCKTFPYIETEDQIMAIQDVISDLESCIPMDRLICGDVGFGKTEVAIRAAFIVSRNNKQVILLAPTSLLVKQHFENFTKRFSDFGIKVCQLSRFLSPANFKYNLLKIKNGEINIIIATHAALSNKIEFQDLGLLIIDEEQHFGVHQKEFFKKMKPNVNIMTLTATPIPRTFELAVSGIRDLSIIATAPTDRVPVKTYICDYKKETIKIAIEKELNRNGQVFFVSPRIEFLEKIMNTIYELFPGVRAETCNGQMPSEKIENVIERFILGEIDVLVSTHIIDSGIDIKNANSIIVYRADLFGLSQLYQLRGRVGRSNRQAYAYLFFPEGENITEDAKKRLMVMKKLNTLGSGFDLASYDMDLRGCGNVIGEEQSGHIKEVGIELFQSMLRESVIMLKSGVNKTIPTFTPQINISIPVFIPETYIEDVNIRTSLYRRIGDIISFDDLESIEIEFIDRFGEIPQEVYNLFFVIKLKILCLKANIDKIDIGKNGVLISFFNDVFFNPKGLIDLINGPFLNNDFVSSKIRNDQKIIIKKQWRDIPSVLKDIVSIITKIVKLNFHKT